LRCYYYDAFPAQSSPPTVDETAKYASKKAFFHTLNHLDYFECRSGICTYITVGTEKKPIQKEVDILLGVDLTQLAATQAITDAIMIAGDRDFLPAIKVAKAAGVCIHLFHGNTYSKDLSMQADTRHSLDKELLEKWEDPLRIKQIQAIANKVVQANKPLPLPNKTSKIRV
jgi:uncharacterized LabA/DUF88 family protein